MSDPRYSGSPKNASTSGADNSQGTGSPMQQVGNLASDLTKQATETAEYATRQVKDQAAGLAESAKGLASDATEKLRTAAEDQKNAGADYISGVAGAVRRAAGEFDDQIPQAGQYIRQAADYIDDAADAVRTRNLNDLLGGIQDFARRQPTAFLGVTVLAGFAVVRFLKSSTAPESNSLNYNRQSEAGHIPQSLPTSGRTSFPPSSGGIGTSPERRF